MYPSFFDEGPDPDPVERGLVGSPLHGAASEVERADCERARVTAGWAVATVAGMITFGFGVPETSHVVVLAAVPTVGAFWALEVRAHTTERTRWAQRLYLLLWPATFAAWLGRLAVQPGESAPPGWMVAGATVVAAAIWVAGRDALRGRRR